MWVSETELKMFLGSRARPLPEADTFIAIYEPIVYKMWHPQRHTTLYAFMGMASFYDRDNKIFSACVFGENKPQWHTLHMRCDRASHGEPSSVLSAAEVLCDTYATFRDVNSSRQWLLEQGPVRCNAYIGRGQMQVEGRPRTIQNPWKELSSAVRWPRKMEHVFRWDCPYGVWRRCCDWDLTESSKRDILERYANVKTNRGQDNCEMMTLGPPRVPR
jgi:hypothetical protein